jgi:hypothetical protein
MATPAVESEERVRLSFSGDTSKMAFAEFDLKAKGMLDRRNLLQYLLDEPPQVLTAAWIKANRSIYTELILHVTGDAYQVIEPLSYDGRAAWAALAAKYEATSIERAYESFLQLFG